jgi:hypothetical protein
MPDYQQGKIYTIRCRTDDTLVYVGSTIQPLYKRFDSHKRNSKLENKKNIPLYKKVNEDWNNWYIELYEVCPCNTREELCRKEGEVIREIGNINIRIAGRTSQEYMKEWEENNKTRRAEYHKEYEKTRKGKRAEYYKARKDRKHQPE